MNTREDTEERETVVLSCRVSDRFAQLVRKFCSLDSHLNPADLLRDSVREKIAKEAPRLYAEMFEEQHCRQCAHWENRCLKGYVAKHNGDTVACPEFMSRERSLK